MAALDLTQSHLSAFARGAYVYVVMRWSVSGSREIERLEYMARSLDHDQFLDGNQAEQLVNTAALTRPAMQSFPARAAGLKLPINWTALTR